MRGHNWLALATLDLLNPTQHDHLEQSPDLATSPGNRPDLGEVRHGSARKRIELVPDFFLSILFLLFVHVRSPFQHVLVRSVHCHAQIREAWSQKRPRRQVASHAQCLDSPFALSRAITNDQVELQILPELILGVLSVQT